MARWPWATPPTDASGFVGGEHKEARDTDGKQLVLDPRVPALLTSEPGPGDLYSQQAQGVSLAFASRLPPWLRFEPKAQPPRQSRRKSSNSPCLPETKAISPKPITAGQSTRNQ
jgi:hypothetical protein